MLFIDEFQVYSNPGFTDMLTMGRSYRVASHLATQARDQIGMGGGDDGKAFIQSVSTNARNKRPAEPKIVPKTTAVAENCHS